MTSILKYLNRALLVLLLAAFAACSDNEGGNESNGNGDDGIPKRPPTATPTATSRIRTAIPSKGWS